MIIKIAVWEHDNEHVLHEEHVNWGEDTLKQSETVRNIIADAIQHYNGFDKSVVLFGIDIWDDSVAKREEQEHDHYV